MALELKLNSHFNILGKLGIVDFVSLDYLFVGCLVDLIWSFSDGS